MLSFSQISPMRTVVTLAAAFIMSGHISADELALRLRLQTEQGFETGHYESKTRAENWKPNETAIIVCDVWDLHHCLNAVRRVEEFAPRLNEVLTAARKQGVTIIHSPSDCMPSYENHPARIRASKAPTAARVPHDIATWCSVVPAEQRGIWPIDQSDGGEDDDPKEHAEWVEQLTAKGRNPGTPWKKQSDLLTVDSEVDYISDRGDEVWNILEERNIRNVILTGVHTNMCVIGRPFGLRQMARNGKNVVLMRDMTDTMYNPKRWPYVSHFTGTDLIIAHIERHVCPTITSDQIIGGSAFKFKGADQPTETNYEFARKYLAGESVSKSEHIAAEYDRHWSVVPIPADDSEVTQGPSWYRCTVRVPNSWCQSLRVEITDNSDATKVWLNGNAISRNADSFSIDAKSVFPDDANLLVLKLKNGKKLSTPPTLSSDVGSMKLEGNWQFRVGDNEQFADIPLPAKFGSSADIVFVPEEPLWQARPVTQPHEFTPGIEGPACNPAGNIFAVNFGRQGTIGRINSKGAGEVFVELPEGSVGNGIRFHPSGRYFYVADYTKHNVLRVDTKTRQISTLGHNAAMNQPNDLAIAPDGTLFASDPNWGNGTGQLWRIDQTGDVTKLAVDMGTTNGIDVTPDGKRLFVNESVQRNIWSFEITANNKLANKQLFKRFDDHGFDGMRFDIEGNLYVTRYGKGTVVKLSPSGDVLQEIDVLGSRPSNLCFGGHDGRTIYVTEVDSTRLVSFRVDKPGRAWKEWQKE